MTSTTDTAEHPEVAEISDLAEGLLPASRTTDLRRHLDGCPLCADVYASLEEIRGLLGTLPDPPRMPADVAGRIDAALAAEALLDSLAVHPDPTAAPRVSADDTSDASEEVRLAASRTAPTSGTRETTDSVSRETSPADPTANEPAVRSVERPSGRPRGAVGPGRKNRSPRRRTGAAFGAVLTAAALGVGVLLLQQDGDDAPTAHRNGARDTFAEGSLDTKVSELLGTGPSAFASPSTEKPSFGTQDSGPKTPQSVPLPKRATTVPACVQLGTHRNEDPLAAEKGTYDGKSVYLVVLPHKTDPAHRVTAFIVDSACTQQAASATGEVLYTHDYARG
ncbi:anti-sigma factor family protein [Streptomyces sp. NPDC049813]|uniref:anti-sigma factor family protein n=1 Tax=Streptomyces sp. NPDC049813 TaxID=3365597 RepID=UPI0037B82DE5